ncbi:hypothetical protein [uncultured Dokdonia sp.]|uniref:hypothetical protein n=1 Tax=uncultured Dokdonia sp. TaxID=575653 RepID=UPI0026054E5A|nr:hypothetical protein [uncultured Dokdonia sp.]
MLENQIYPVISDLLPLEKIPSDLEGIKEALENVLRKVYFKDLIVSKSYHGESGYYSLTLISIKQLGLDVPFASGFSLVINPTDEGISEIPISFQYRWEVLKYFNQFSFESFTNSIDSIFEILIELAGISKEDLLGEVLSVFYEQTNALELFVNQINDDFFTTIPVNNNVSEIDQLPKIINNIERLDINLYKYIFDTFLSADSFADSFERLKRLLEKWYGNLKSTDISEILKLKFNVSIPQVNLGLLFPRTWLIPVDEELNQLEEPARSGLTFNVGALEYSTNNGFEFINESNFSFTRSEIGNTGLIAEFEGLKLDLSNTSNIPEAIADGRSEDFKGVYIDYAAITLPKKWFQENDTADTARISGYNLLVGTGGLSGKIALEVLLAAGTITEYYQSKFTVQYPVSATRTNPDTNVLEVATLTNHAELVAHYNLDQQIRFVYPFSVIDTASGETLTFKDPITYNSYLAKANITSATPRVGFSIGGFELGLTSFDITFSQGSIVESNIKGLMKIPGLKDTNNDPAEILVTGHLDDNGDFSLTLAEEDGVVLSIPHVADLTIYSLAYIRENDRGYVEVASDLTFTNGVVTKVLCDQNQKIPLPTMRFYANPAGFEIVGGSIAVPESFSLCLGPVDISVANINQGSHQRMFGDKMRKYKYWGFDGAISINPLGIDVRGDGLKFYHTIDNEYIDEHGNPVSNPPDSYMHIRALGVDLIIPGNASPKEAAVIIKGYLSLPEPGESPEYEGSVTAKIGKLGITASASMRLAPKHPAFIIDADVDLKTGIPIGATGLEITAFRGLFGYRYVAEKEAVGLTSGNTDDTWYDYYVYPKRGINIKKFNTPDKTGKYKNPISIGAGATINTKGVNVVSTRVMLLLSIPSLFVIDGRASIISKKWGLDDSGEPPFFAFLAIGDQSIELGVGADFKIPQKTGKLISVQASVEAAFFFRDPSAWYVYVGRKDQPNEGKVLNILTAQTYLELSARGIQLGARAEFLFNKKFGPAKIKAWLFVEVGGKLSFERPQIGGYFEAGGGLEIKVWIISASVSFNAILAVEAPRPFLIRAEVRVCARVKIGFIKVTKHVKVEIKWEFNKQIDKTPVLPYPSKDETLALEQIQGIHMLTGETFGLINLTNQANTRGDSTLFNNAIIPLDTYIDIKFLKGLSVTRSRDPQNKLNSHLSSWGITEEVNNLIGGVSNPPVDNVELIPPDKTVKGGHTVRQVAHKYHINGLNLEAWNGTSWVGYNPYEAVTAKSSENLDVSDFKIGHWQKTRKAYDQIRLLASNPFTYTEQGEDGWYVPEELGITASTLFCEAQFKPLQTVNWRNRRRGEKYPVPFSNPDSFFNIGQLYFQILGTGILGDEDFIQPEFGKVASGYSNFDFPQSLKIRNTNGIALKFPNAVQEVRLKLSSTARGVRIKLYKAVFEETAGTPVVSYELIPDGDIYKLSSELYQEVIFSSDEYTIDRVEIDPETENEEEIDRIREEIAVLLENALGSFSLNPRASLDREDQERYDLLISELEEAKNIGCDMSIPPPRGIGAMQIKDDDINGTFIVGENAFGNDGIALPPMTDTSEKCFTLLHEVQWLTVHDWAYNQEIPGQEAITSDFMNSVDAVEQVATPIWRPDTSYRVTFTVSDLVNNEEIHSFPYRFGFKTAGPIGHYHNAPNVTYGGTRNTAGQLVDPNAYPLTSLASYIDYQRSYPNANGSLLNAKPLFYGTEDGNNEIKLFFNKPYLNHMMEDWGAFGAFSELSGRMQVLIKDPVENVILNNPPIPGEETTEIPSGQESWDPDAHPQLASYVQTLQNMVDGTNGDASLGSCRIELGDVIIPKSYNTTVIINNLKPQKLYTAIVNSHYENSVVQVHDFNFQTSRYQNFKEQVESYLLKDIDGNITREAIYDLSISASVSQITEAYNVVSSGMNNNAFAKEIDPFDRVVEGLLGIKPMDPAATTEFNRLRNAEGTIIGILIRNPEPFNNPNIPREVIMGTTDTDLKTISVLNNSGDDNDKFKVLHSKDYAQCLIMKQEIREEIPLVQISNYQRTILFRYLKWDGNTYINQTEVTIENLRINN